jgi:hypothetical protein
MAMKSFIEVGEKRKWRWKVSLKSMKKENGDEKFHWSRWKKWRWKVSLKWEEKENGDEKFHWYLFRNLR